jgi:ferrous iron transport protein B
MISKEITVALAGQPNVGKSTVFNILTGLSQHVGNWPGKTIEKKEGIYVVNGKRLKIVDLPGTYSLTAYSEEEKIARDFVINERPDVVVLIINAPAIERGLYLLSEFLLLNVPIVVALNMIDVADDQGIHIDVNLLQRYLGIPVVPMIASKNKGIKELISVVLSLVDGSVRYSPSLPNISEDHKDLFIELSRSLNGYISPPYLNRWFITKIMEGDPDVTDKMSKRLPPDIWNKVKSLLREHEDSLLAVVKGRYDWIEGAVRTTISEFKRGQVLFTDKLDDILTRPIFGIPILFGILTFVFIITYGLGLPIQYLLESSMSYVAGYIEPFISESFWLRGIVIEGLIGGAGTVLTFLPILFFFFLIMAFLEDVGYMARATFIMDRFMHLIGLHGKSFLPLCIGFGCNVPAVMGSRILESTKSKILTIFLTPFIPCTAKLAVVTLISAAMFGKKGIIISLILVMGNILLLGITGTIMSRFIIKSQHMPFIMELPFYHKPNFRTILVVVWIRIKAFLEKAGTIIVLLSIILWLFSHIPGGDVERSILGMFGKVIEPIGKPIGLDWRMIVALMASIAARENSIAALGVLYNVKAEGIRNVLPHVMSYASALSFLVMLMLFVPCAATLVVMKQEMGEWRWFLTSFIFMIFLSYLSGAIVFRCALILGL